VNAKLWKLRNLPTRLRGVKAEIFNLLGIGVCVALEATHIAADGTRTPLGIVSRRVVTDTGVGYLVDALQNLTEAENLNWHDAGTGVGAEAVGNTTLGTPFGGSRVSGTQTEPASNQYRTTATIPFTSSLAITEHGLFSASSSGTLFDRSVFSAINVVNGDSIQFQYTLTLTSGG
jgi:hypothetical protein